MEENNSPQRFSSNEKQDPSKPIDNRPQNDHPKLKNQLKLRNVKKDDKRFLFELRNDPSVRESSFNTESISLTTHKEWFQKKLKAKDSLILIAEYRKQRIGQIRFDIDEMANNAEVSIAILPAFRRKGLGENILKMGCRNAFEKLSINTILAFIKKENFISVKTFSKAGFMRKGYSKYKGYNSIEMKLEIGKVKRT